MRINATTPNTFTLTGPLVSGYAIINGWNYFYIYNRIGASIRYSNIYPNGTYGSRNETLNNNMRNRCHNNDGIQAVLYYKYDASTRHRLTTWSNIDDWEYLDVFPTIVNWVYNAIKYCSDNRLMSGKPANNQLCLVPKGQASRAECASILATFLMYHFSFPLTLYKYRDEIRKIVTLHIREEIHMKKIMLIFGTRPEAIKMCPLINELKRRPAFHTIVCVTGQHRQMLDQVLDVFCVKPDHDLSIMKPGQTLFDITSNILSRLKDLLEKENPDIVLVHGDTSTTFSAALACFYLQIPVGHVEAGLRTYNTASPYPEEFNRQAVGSIAKYHFAPTVTAKQNLLREGKKPDDIFVTGNTAIDALRTTVKNDYHHPDLEWARESRLIMITAHRRENLGEPMIHMFRAIRSVLREYSDVKAVYPIHMNPLVRKTADEVFGHEERIRLIEPLDVLDFHNFLAQSYLVLTDSGGIQEEAPSLGKPVLVMRDTTERPEGIEAGTLKLVGTSEESIYRSFKRLLENKDEYEKMSLANNPYGDGFASKRIADILETSL